MRVDDVHNSDDKYSDDRQEAAEELVAMEGLLQKNDR